MGHLVITERIKQDPLWLDLNPQIVEDFWPFHAENPHVYEMYFTLASQLKSRRPTSRYSIHMISQQIRWMYTTDEISEAEYKVNAKWPSCYGRLLVLARPDMFAGFFQFRTSHNSPNAIANARMLFEIQNATKENNNEAITCANQN